MLQDKAMIFSLMRNLIDQQIRAYRTKVLLTCTNFK